MSEEQEIKDANADRKSNFQPPQDLISPQNSESLVKITENDLHSNKSSDTTSSFRSEASFSQLSYQPEESYLKAPDTQRAIMKDITNVSTNSNVPLNSNTGKPPEHSIFTKRSVAQCSFASHKFPKPASNFIVSDSFSEFENYAEGMKEGKTLESHQKSNSNISNLEAVSHYEPKMRERSDFSTSGSYDAISRILHDQSQFIQFIQYAPSLNYCHFQRIHHELYKKNEEYQLMLKRFTEDPSTPLYENLLNLISRERRNLIEDYLALVKLSLEQQKTKLRDFEKAISFLEVEKNHLKSSFNNIGSSSVLSQGFVTKSPATGASVPESHRLNRFAAENTAPYFPFPLTQSSIVPEMRSHVNVVYYAQRDNLSQAPQNNIRSKSTNRF